MCECTRDTLHIPRRDDVIGYGFIKNIKQAKIDIGSVPEFLPLRADLGDRLAFLAQTFNLSRATTMKLL
jgi:hypothetical protein